MASTKKTLRRIPQQQQIAGVCAGIADYFDLDVTLVRVIFVTLAFVTGGAMIIFYIILAIILPSEQTLSVSKHSASNVSADDDSIGEKVQQLGQDLQENKGIERLRNYLGVGLLILGTWLLLAQFFPQWLAFRWEYVWPVLLIFIGFLILTKKR